MCTTISSSECVGLVKYNGEEPDYQSSGDSDDSHGGVDGSHGGKSVMEVKAIAVMKMGHAARMEATVVTDLEEVEVTVTKSEEVITATG